MRTLALAGCLVVMTVACSDSPSSPDSRLNEQFTLAAGASTTVDDTNLQIRFVGVSGDSRCPADAVCIQGGDAVVRVRVSGLSLPAEYELHTGDSRGAQASHGPYRIALIQLQPYPFSSGPIAAGDYRATLEVTRP